MTSIWMMRAQAAMWLRYTRQCQLVTFERGSGMCGVPDVLGLTPNRRLIEVEIKRTMADFRHNAKKWTARRRGEILGFYYPQQPYQFYFFVEAKMAEKCMAELPDWAGLMAAPGDNDVHRSYGNILYPIVKVGAPISKLAGKVSIKECHAMAKHQAGTLTMVLNAIAKSHQDMVNIRDLDDTRPSAVCPQPDRSPGPRDTNCRR